jgi:hypothetical protein
MQPRYYSLLLGAEREPGAFAGIIVAIVVIAAVLALT